MCVAATVLLLAIAAVVPTFWSQASLPGQPSRFDCVALAFAFPAFVAALSFVKMSVSALVVVGAGYLYFRLGLFKRSVPAGLSAAFSVVVFLGVTPFVLNAAGAGGIFSFHFIREYLSVEWIGYFLLGQFAWLLVAALARLRQVRITTVASAIDHLRNGELIDVEVCLVVGVVGLLPATFLEIKGGSAYYFLCVQHILAAAILLSVLYTGRRLPRCLGRRFWRCGRVTVGNIAFSFVLISMMATLMLNSAFGLFDLVRTNLYQRGLVADTEARREVKQALYSGSLGEGWKIVQQSTARMEGASDSRSRLISALRKLQGLPLGERRVSALFIPKRNREFWELLPADSVTPLLAPALTELAMIAGLPDADFHAYGYASYKLARVPERIWSPEEAKGFILQRAAELGFQRVIVVDRDAAGRPVLDEWHVENAQVSRLSLPTLF